MIFPVNGCTHRPSGPSRFPHNYKLYNLLRIKKVGLEKWAAQEASAIRDNYFTGEHPILQKAGKSMKK
jgi:hypothetical protein